MPEFGGDSSEAERAVGRVGEREEDKEGRNGGGRFRLRLGLPAGALHDGESLQESFGVHGPRYSRVQSFFWGDHILVCACVAKTKEKLIS